MKPYRLINSLELVKLSLHVQPIVEQWSNDYCLMPLTMELFLPHKNYVPKEQFLITLANMPLASISQNYTEVLNQALFGVNKPCFNATSQELILTLLNLILKTEDVSLTAAPSSTQDWFYRGSTSLILNIHTATDHFTITLHPDWVYQNIPFLQATANNLKKLDDAVAYHNLALNLELTSITLPLHQLVSLKAGDVIATDHPISAPVHLKQQDQVVAQADLGQSSQYKSIILKRFS